ncbi:hypothetical protein [Microbulbifer sp. TYP-18]|uniref:hypothetical protein n=1 Tax=Microbulbifer sp. TYP-18 TaxID=3230024 RepID=UPI0034C611AE
MRLYSGIPRSLLTGLLVLGLAFGATNALAQEGSEDDFWERHDDIVNAVTLRLKLTPEQESVILPIFDQDSERRRSLLTQYGFSKTARPKLSRVQKEELSAKMLGISAEFRAKLAPVLDAKQFELLKEIQMEFQKEFNRRLMAYNP